MSHKESRRQFGRASIEELTRLYELRGQDISTLQALREELSYRKPAKTEALRTAVNRHFARATASPSPRRADTAPAPVVLSCTRCATRLRLAYQQTKGQARCPQCSQDYDVAWTGAACLVQPRPQAAPAVAASTVMTIAAARQLVGVRVQDPWDPTIKKACRSLLQQLHPDKCASAPLAVQRLAEAEFKRVKSAYEMLEAHYVRRTVGGGL